jgi:hypothetical protein
MPRSPRAFWICILALTVSLTAGCHTLRWPWGARSEPASAAVTELIVSAPEGAAIPSLSQYWMRNTLVIDLQSVTGSGRARLAPKPGASWPARIGFRVRPGAFGALDVRGTQRVVLPIAPEGGDVHDLELVPGIYTASTEFLEIAWLPAQSPGG